MMWVRAQTGPGITMTMTRDINAEKADSSRLMFALKFKASDWPNWCVFEVLEPTDTNGIPIKETDSMPEPWGSTSANKDFRIGRKDRWRSQYEREVGVFPVLQDNQVVSGVLGAFWSLDGGQSCPSTFGQRMTPDIIRASTEKTHQHDGHGYLDKLAFTPTGKIWIGPAPEKEKIEVYKGLPLSDGVFIRQWYIAYNRQNTGSVYVIGGPYWIHKQIVIRTPSGDNYQCIVKGGYIYDELVSKWNNAGKLLGSRQLKPAHGCAKAPTAGGGNPLPRGGDEPYLDYNGGYSDKWSGYPGG